MTSIDESFTPRKEFIREHRPYFNSFSLLTVSRANLVRLYSFPPPVVTALRQFLDQFSLLIGFRENPTANYYEVSLEGKPWAAPKSIASETLLLSILTIIYNHGHSYSSTIDYGREQDDRLFMVFQRTIPQLVNSPPGSMRTPSPASPIGIAEHASTTTLDLNNKRIPFALSFPSATVLRVINPPLHSTPAILQAVRSSWPRGVVSEKKIGEVAFEFKLKGYKWYQEDTFATDSLNHILTLLASLDAHSFSLLTSISLTNRSRVKDLWIFTGPAASPTDQMLDSPPPSLQGSPRIIGQPFSAEAFGHQRLATVPTPSTPPAAQYTHVRAATIDASSRPVPPSPLAAMSTPPNALPLGPGLLRKPAPRAQVPISVVQAEDEEMAARDDESDEFPIRPRDAAPQPIREQLPSNVPEGTENMTGVGAAGAKTPDVFYASSPFFITNASPHHATESQHSINAESHHTETTVTPPLDASGHSMSQESTSRPNSPHHHDEVDISPALLGPGAFRDSGMPSHDDRLLGPDTFRDSAFSSSGNSSAQESIDQLPVMWNGKGPDLLQADTTAVSSSHSSPDEPSHQQSMSLPKLVERTSSGPMLPGAWAPTPVEERFPPLEHTTPRPQSQSLQQDQEYTEGGEKATTPVYEVEHRVQSPEFTSSPEYDRRSEAGLLMMGPPEVEKRETVVESPLPVSGTEASQMDSHDGAPGISSGSTDVDPRPSPHTSTSTKGWVIVDIEGRHASGPAIVESPNANADTSRSTSTPAAPHAAQSSAAKQIAAVDAIETLQKKQSSKDSNGAATPGSAFSNPSDSSLRLSEQTSGKKGGGRVRRFFSLSKKSKQGERQRTGSGFQAKLTNVGE